jgi:hypothetical protein
MPKTFDPDIELPDLGGKVIVVTGGTILFFVSRHVSERGDCVESVMESSWKRCLGCLALIPVTARRRPEKREKRS